jgi:hypothetical protein
MPSKEPAPPLPASLRFMTYQRPKNTSAGMNHDSASLSQLDSRTRLYGTSKRDSRSASAGSTSVETTRVLPSAGERSVPVTLRSPI